MSAKPPTRPRIARLLTTLWAEALSDRKAAKAEIATTPMNDLLNALFHLAEVGTDLIYMVIAWNKASSRKILSEWIGEIGQTAHSQHHEVAVKPSLGGAIGNSSFNFAASAELPWLKRLSFNDR
jgi:hypothetical protein